MSPSSLIGWGGEQKEQGLQGDELARRIIDALSDKQAEDVLLLEIKAVANIEGKHNAQALNYLRGSDLELGFVLNFGPSPQFQRLIYTNDRKLRLPSVTSFASGTADPSASA